MPPLQDPLLFIHVPKTAGTSFRIAAAEYFGAERCWSDYGPAAAETTAEVRQHVHEAGDLWALRRAMLARSPAMLAGHVHASRFAGLLPLLNVVSFVREPLAQLRSHYLHQCRDNGYRGSPEAFMHGPMGIGFQSRLLSGMPLEACGFIGVTERYEESLSLLNEVWGLDLPPRRLNERPVPPAGQALPPEPFPPALAASFLQAAVADVQLYRRANDLLDERVRLRALGQPYTHGVVQTRTLHRLQGFAFRRQGEDALPVELLVNGRVRAQTLAAADRPGLRALQAPRGGYVGFDFRLEGMGIATTDELTARLADTGQVLGRLLPPPARSAGAVR